jgi:ORF6N domain-containing protein
MAREWRVSAQKTMARYGNISALRKIESVIVTIRSQKVILDMDLARIYGVPTKRLKEQVKRNRERFPADFVFELTDREKEEVVANCDHLQSLRFSAFRPSAFTEHGAIMAANILNSAQAVKMSVFVVRAFVKMRELLVNRRELANELAELERRLGGRLDAHEIAIVEVLQRMMQILDPPPPPPEPPKPQIGFRIKEGAVPYRVKRRIRC